MSELSKQLAPRYVTCQCKHCEEHIEFDANEFAEENSILPCPHCGLETKIFIPVLQAEKIPTKLPFSNASPSAVRREGFFCGGNEPSLIEQSATEVSHEWRFTIVANIQQGTDTWIEWRHNGIGASDASTVMGENRFKSYSQLLQEKRGPARDFGQNAAMARGTELEPEARRLYIAETGRAVRPACLQSTRYDWLRASVDGIATSGDAVVEIKCGQSAYRTAKQTRSVPDYYYGQMQHILAVTGYDSLDFWCYWPGYPALLIPVPRNNDYIQRLLKSELEFWNLVQQNAS
jgi:putative phage-type endonuclease